MKDGFTFIAVVLDRSGSMEIVRSHTIGGFNSFLREQQAHPGEALLTLAQFDDQYEIVHDAKPLKEVPPLTAETYVPRGSTALRDAIGRTIVSVGARLSAMPEPERPAKVIVLVLTDGHENASKEYSEGALADLVRQQREKYSWEFVFLGANQDAGMTAKGLAFNPQNAITYDSSAVGTSEAISVMSNGLRAYRSSKDAQSEDFFGKGKPVSK